VIGHISGPEYPSWQHKPEPGDGPADWKWQKLNENRRARQREYATNVLTWLCIIAVCAGAWGLFVATTTWVVKCVWEG
jgi:hypothetical protein